MTQLVVRQKGFYGSIINPLPNDKVLDLSKLNAFADDKINFVKMLIWVFDRAGNIVGTGENAGYWLILKPIHIGVYVCVCVFLTSVNE